MSDAVAGERRARALKTGDFVVHTGREDWGIGKILQGRSGTNLTVLFDNGVERVISRHYHSYLSTVAKPLQFTAVPLPKDGITTRKSKKTLRK